MTQIQTSNDLIPGDLILSHEQKSGTRFLRSKSKLDIELDLELYDFSVIELPKLFEVISFQYTTTQENFWEGIFRIVQLGLWQ